MCGAGNPSCPTTVQGILVVMSAVYMLTQDLYSCSNLQMSGSKTETQTFAQASAKLGAQASKDSQAAADLSLGKNVVVIGRSVELVWACCKGGCSWQADQDGLGLLRRTEKDRVGSKHQVTRGPTG